MKGGKNMNRLLYGISDDPHIQSIFNLLSPESQDAVLRRDLLDAIRSGLSVDTYLHLISNPKEGFLA